MAKQAWGLLTLMEGNWLELHRQHSIQLLEQVETVEKLIEAKEQQLERGYAEADPPEHLKSIRRRLPSRKRPSSGTDKTVLSETQKSRDSQSPQITSELEAPRSGQVPRLDDLTSERLSLTKDQLAMFVFRNLDRLLNSGGNIQEIQLTARPKGCVLGTLHLRLRAPYFYPNNDSTSPT